MKKLFNTDWLRAVRMHKKSYVFQFLFNLKSIYTYEFFKKQEAYAISAF